jgi:UPF0271 protein
LHSKLVLDAGAFYAGTAFLSSDQVLYATPQVLAEIEHIKSHYAAIEALRDSGRVVIHAPAQQKIDEVSRAVRKTGYSGVLSEADISIIALALELRALLVTDDFSVSNVAATLGIAVKPATSGKEIRQVRKLIYYCSACGKTFRPGQKICPLCGNRLKRKYKQVRAGSQVSD